MILDYDNCEICPHTRNLRKNDMAKLFLGDICDKIVSFISCKKCEQKLLKENEFMKKQKDTSFSKVELQIQFFVEHNKIPFTLARTNPLKKKELIKIIDKIDDNLKTVMKSFVRNSRFRNWILFFINNVGNRNKILHDDYLDTEIDMLKDETFEYFNKSYNSNILMKMILHEYLCEIIRDDFLYIDIGDVQEYLDNIFNH